MKKEDISEAARALGRKGGQAKTEAKRKASAENGKKGGRPRKEGIECKRCGNEIKFALKDLPPVETTMHKDYDGPAYGYRLLECECGWKVNVPVFGEMKAFCDK